MSEGDRISGVFELWPDEKEGEGSARISGVWERVTETAEEVAERERARAMERAHAQVARMLERARKALERVRKRKGEDEGKG